MFKVTASPHIRDNMTTQKIMLLVIISLLPALIGGFITFGLRAVIVTLVCTASCVIFEALTRIIMKRPQTVSDLSACVTGILLAMNLPVTIPIWQAVIGSFVAVVIAKQLFGGLGQNFVNPAILARIVLMLSFTADMTTWAVPHYWKENSADIVTSATPLVSRDASYWDLFIGNTGGCVGEVCALGLIIGGLFLIFTGIISPVTPLAFIGTVALAELIAGNDPIYHILSGGLLLGAFFMATDYVTTPLTSMGKLIFGIGCGIITFVIREFGGYPEGVSFSILLMNIITPYIDNFTAKKALGAVYAGKGDK
ncbi:MAG: RnfABCDGE type electron transport complex subunit D [Ruminococcus sp.]|nr:RnfABCDGE type electron transport complex subunit D [Oscillospiraceae bacterium]MDY4414266.1 RnfABCDGE type electron transport complex subunit D [Ruminococcus sp.]